MGVSGLLPLLKQIQEPTSLMRYKGKTLAIDTYAWLHRSIMGCTMELAQDKPTNKYINYTLKRLDMLEHFGIEPYFVFDGDYLPCKNKTEVNREQKRNEYKRQGLQALSKGDSRTAFSCFQKSCDITPDMAKLLIDVFKKRNVKYVVAPYEADSQMVYLEKMGIVDGIISEDSDLLIFGCRRLITKLNDKGECVEINRDNFSKCKQVPVNYLSLEQLIMVASLSGCDYTKGIPGIGIIKAFGLVKRYGTMEKIIAALKLEGKYTVGENFMEEYEQASYAFKFQLVFDPVRNLPTNLSQFPYEATPMMKTCSGERFDDSLHQQIAKGDLHPIEKTPLHSRELLLLQKNGTAMRTGSLYQVPGYTPIKVASRAYSTPVSIGVLKYKNIDNFFTKKSKNDDINKTPTSTKRQLLPMENTPVSEKLSPTSKRKRILHGTTSKITTMKASKFFAIHDKRNKDTDSVESQKVSDVDESQNSINMEELHDDTNISELTNDEDNNKQIGVKNLLQHELNSSDFEIDELSENEDANEQIILTQTQTTSTNVSKENLLSSLNETIEAKDVPPIEQDEPINVNRKLIIDDVRLGLRNRFRLESKASTRVLHANRTPLQALDSNVLPKRGNTNKTEPKINLTGSFLEKTGKLNLNSFRFNE